MKNGNSRKGGYIIKAQIRVEGTPEEIKRLLKKLPDQSSFKQFDHVTELFAMAHHNQLRLTCYLGGKPEFFQLDVVDAGKVEIPIANLIQIEAKAGVMVFAGETVDMFSEPKTKKSPEEVQDANS